MLKIIQFLIIIILYAQSQYVLAVDHQDLFDQNKDKGNSLDTQIALHQEYLNLENEVQFFLKNEVDPHDLETLQHLERLLLKMKQYHGVHCDCDKE